jgi:hypothetical protein
MDNHYSDKELKLFEHFGYDLIAPHIPAPRVYDLMAMDAFRLNMKSDKYVESLRRVYTALVTVSIKRGTKAFDDLIDID